VSAADFPKHLPLKRSLNLFEGVELFVSRIVPMLSETFSGGWDAPASDAQTACERATPRDVDTHAYTHTLAGSPEESNLAFVAPAKTILGL